MTTYMTVQTGCTWDPNTCTSACCSSPVPFVLQSHLSLLLWDWAWIVLGRAEIPLFRLLEPGSEAGDPVDTIGGPGLHDTHAGTLHGESVVSATCSGLLWAQRQ